MGDPRKPRKKYETPRHPWQSSRIEAEKILSKDYGLKNKKEIWKARALLRKFTNQAKKLSNIKTLHYQREKEQLLVKLSKLNLVKENAELEEVLGLTVNNILDRRLQTIVFKKGLAKTADQARQFITHGHIKVKDQRVDIPSYLVKLEEESFIDFVKNSNLSNLEHPERIIKKEIKNEKVIKNE